MAAVGIDAVREAAEQYGWAETKTEADSTPKKVRFQRGDRSVTVWHGPGGRIVRAETFQQGGGWKQARPSDGLKLDTVRGWLREYGAEPQGDAQGRGEARMDAPTDSPDASVRLFRVAVDNAKRKAGVEGWRMVGLELRKALVMAEVAYIVSQQDGDAAGPAMIRLARYAAETVEAL